MATTSFKNIVNIGDPHDNEVIESNIISYIDWCFLQTGAYYNVSIPSSGSYGGNRHILRPVDDPRYTAGQVWEAYRSNWIWESGIAYSEQPIAISGIFVNGSFLPNNSGYYINYIDGQIIFDTAIATNSTVQLEYSHKLMNVVSADSVPWFREGQTRSFRLDDDSFLVGSGIWNKLAQTRVQLPAIAVETLGISPHRGYQLGGGQYRNTQVLLHVLGEDGPTTRRIAGILSEQNEATIYLYDLKRMMDNNAYPLDYRGTLSSNPLTYPDLIAPTGDGGYRFTNGVQNGSVVIYNTTERHTPNTGGGVYHSVVKWETEAILFRI